MKLWQKGDDIDKAFERFTVGDDRELDRKLVKYDLLASRAHARMLESIRLLTKKECKLIIAELDRMLELDRKGEFRIRETSEDCHSEIEIRLTEALGDTGKKIHSGRSRNDQVLVALKLFAKEQLTGLAGLLEELFYLLLDKSEQNKEVLMPGYTHMQMAMPSSFGLWFSAYAEGLSDDLIFLRAAYELADKNPLGSAAGYGASFPLDREMTTRELGFAGLDVNAVYAQTTRGRLEKAVAMGISMLAGTLARFANDVCVYSGQNFGFFELDRSFTTGSSIMPHKNNPDGFELVRSQCNQLQFLPTEINAILVNLPTGYHRDLQLLKGTFMRAIQKMSDCLKITISMTKGLEVRRKILDGPEYDLLFTVEDVNNRVMKGAPFRDAYREVAEDVKSGRFQPDRSLAHTHIGSIGNLRNDLIKAAFMERISLWKST